MEGDLVKLESIETSALCDETFGNNDDCGKEKEESFGSCYFCNEEFELTDLYRCITCHISDDGVAVESYVGADDVSSSNSNCEVCIVSLHLRKKHEIVDHKGYKPALCAKHKIIARLFCQDCNLVFCSSCVINHKKHDFVSVSEKYVETRKLVFEYISELEVLMKPMKHQDDVARNSMEEIKKTVNLLSSDNVVNTLCAAFENTVRNSVSEWGNGSIQKTNCMRLEVPPASQELCDVTIQSTEANETSVEKLKCLLGMADGVCVQNFSEVEKTVKKVLEDQNNRKNSHLYLSYLPDLRHIIGRFLDEMLTQLTAPKIKSIEYNDISPKSPVDFQKADESFDWLEIPSGIVVYLPDFVPSFSEIFNVCYERDSVNFFMLIQTQNEGENYLVKRYSFYKCSVQKVLIYRSYIAFFTSKKIWIYYLKTKFFVHEIDIGDNFEPLEFYCLADGNFRFIVWNFQQSRVQVYNEPDNRSLLCGAKPKIFKNYINVWVIVEPNNDVVVHSLLMKIELKISRLNHGLAQVDNVHFEYPNTLRLFDYKMGVLLAGKMSLGIKDVSFSVEKVTRIRKAFLPLDCISIQESKLLVLAGSCLYVESLSQLPSSEEEDHVMRPSMIGKLFQKHPELAVAEGNVAQSKQLFNFSGAAFRSSMDAHGLVEGVRETKTTGDSFSNSKGRFTFSGVTAKNSSTQLIKPASPVVKRATVPRQAVVLTPVTKIEKQ